MNSFRYECPDRSFLPVIRSYEFAERHISHGCYSYSPKLQHPPENVCAEKVLPLSAFRVCLTWVSEAYRVRGSRLRPYAFCRYIITLLGAFRESGHNRVDEDTHLDKLEIPMWKSFLRQTSAGGSHSHWRT